MANVQNVAKFFIDLAQRQAEHNGGDLATNMRIQKLLYFAQGWHLARYGKPLFSAPVHAWAYGPVVPEVYERYRISGAQGLTTDGVDSSAFTPDELALLLDVAAAYDGLSTSALVEITHQPGAPWSQVQRNAEITSQAMRDYFTAQPKLQTVDELLQTVEIVEPQRTANGVAVLPADLDDDWGEW